MGELLRPPPPRSWRDRLAARFAAVTPARVASGAGAVLLVAVTAWWLLRPGRLPVEAALPRAATSAAARARASTPVAPAAGTPSTSTALAVPLVVQAAGAVVRPGVYRLPDGARVADLVEAAGGPAADADLDRVALAAKLADGQRVAVPRRGEPSPADPAAAATGGAAGIEGPVGPVDLNRATTADLDRLPGVGPATAAAIVAYREAHGAFRSIDELTDVPGIGPAKLAALRGLVTV
jgi:competence protein ComEA